MFSNNNNKKKFTRLLLPLLVISAQAAADYKADIGYTQLQAELGAAVPDGAGVKITQVEASSVLPGNASYPVFAPDPNIDSMTGKTFAYPGLTCATPPCVPSLFSPHGSGVAMSFYGNSTSIAQGIDNIHSHEANQWLGTLYTNTGRALIASTTDRRIANHSWVNTDGVTSDSGPILRLVDRQVNLNEYIQVVATGSPLLANAYNAIAVGTTGSATAKSAAIDGTYVANRAITDLVAPAANRSTATPYVSAAAALLVETGHQETSLSLGSTNTSAGVIYNAERSETIKAALMAGASRETGNTTAYGDISDYRSTGHQTNNGLDSRYGAGQLNVYNSYQIITGGEQNSLEDGGSNSGEIDYAGFDYDAHFGGEQGNNDKATYSFTAFANETIAASLVWNLGVGNNAAMDTTLHHLGLSLKDVSDNTVVASSLSTLDNTQNIFWQNLIAGHEYQLLVSSLEGTNKFNWDYSLAWNRTVTATPVPVPAAFWLFGSALAGLLGFQRKSGPV